MIDTCYLGDVRDGLRAFAAAGIKAQTCVTSPPYWGLRDYGVAGQIGLEPTIAEYVATMVGVFRLVRDALADDGTVFLNLGDSYCADRGNSKEKPGFDNKAAAGHANLAVREHRIAGQLGLKPKDLIGIPWRLAFALQADGWYLRSDIIWHKPNPMPESVTDRPTKAHEYLFLLAKSERYYYDAEAIKEPATGGAHPRVAGWMSGPGARDTIKHARERNVGVGSKVRASKGAPNAPRAKFNQSFDAAVTQTVEARNKRTVWAIPTEAFPEAHFATFPTALVEPCILAGSRVGDVVLDPFMGSGTVAQVAQDLGRRWIGCELNPAYVEMQKRRAAQTGLPLEAA